MTNPLFNLKGKTAIVTGAARGIGKSIAQGFANAGADIVIGDINLDGARKTCEELKAGGVRATAIKCDVAKSEEADDLINLAVNEFGRLDILVNNAGITGAGKPFFEITNEEWQKTLSVNLTGVFNCSRAAGKIMMEQKSGKIINITSIAATKPLPSSGDYCAGKGGALMLTRVMALEMAGHNIQVNAICPGYFDTDLAPDLLAYVKKNIKRMAPANRMGDASEIQGLALLLASEAGDYIVGAAIPIDGGVLINN